MKKILLLILSTVFLYAQDSIQIEAKINQDMSDTYFAYIDFSFSNPTPDWKTLDDVRISFGETKDPYMEMLSGLKFNAWLSATQNRNRNRSADRQIALALIGGLGAAMIGSKSNSGLGYSLIAGATTFETLSAFNRSVTDKKRSLTLPENHLYKEILLLPPGLTTKRFVVFYSKEHQKLGYVNQLTLSYNLDGGEKKETLTFRGPQYIKGDEMNFYGEKIEKKSRYIWENDL